MLFQSPFGDGRFLTVILSYAYRPDRLSQVSIPFRRWPLSNYLSAFYLPTGGERTVSIPFRRWPLSKPIFEDGRTFCPASATVSIPFRRWPLSNLFDGEPLDLSRGRILFQSPFGDGRFLTKRCGCGWANFSVRSGISIPFRRWPLSNGAYVLVDRFAGSW